MSSVLWQFVPVAKLIKEKVIEKYVEPPTEYKSFAPKEKTVAEGIVSALISLFNFIVFTYSLYLVMNCFNKGGQLLGGGFIEVLFCCCCNVCYVIYRGFVNKC